MEEMMRVDKKRLVLAVILGLFQGLTFGCSDDLPQGRNKPVKVDFQNVVKEDREEAAKERLQVMRVAVAAIISPKTTYEYYLDLLNIIGERLNRDVQFVQKRTYTQINEMLKQRKLDLAFVCSGPYVSGNADFGMEIIAVPVSHGKKVYHSYFIVNSDSTIESFDQLRGKTFAFSDPHSNTGCLVPTYFLAKRNEAPESFFKKTFFTYSHDNSIKAVAKGLADGAAVDSLIWEFMNSVEPEMTSHTRIIEKSPPYGIPPVVVHPSVDKETKDKLRNLFLTIHQEPRGKRILKRLQIDRFEPGDDADYDTVREMQRWLASQKESIS
jgi:phosphonate transport system substrate-binding protein